jgi:hypothetical protein
MFIEINIVLVYIGLSEEKNAKRLHIYSYAPASTLFA